MVVSHIRLNGLSSASFFLRLYNILGLDSSFLSMSILANQFFFFSASNFFLKLSLSFFKESIISLSIFILPLTDLLQQKGWFDHAHTLHWLISQA